MRFGPIRWRYREPMFRLVTLVFFLLRMWRALPASQKRRMLQTAGRYGPVILAGLAREARRRRRR